MQITILALGSYGDVVPLATLGKGLQTAGHQVCIATFENFEKLMTNHGLAFYPVRGDAQAILNGGSGQALTESGQNVIKAWWAAMQSFGKLADQMAEDFSDPALQEADLIINQLPGALYGYDLAEKIGVPMLAAAVIPLVRTRHYPMLAFPPQLASLPGYNTFTYQMAEQLMWQWFRPAINRWRAQTLGLPKQSISGYFTRMGQAQIPVVGGFSPHVVPRPPDWSEHVHMTGYWFPEEAAWEPPAELQAFIEAGERPIFVGFGSMSVADPAETTAVIVEALRQSGRRGISHTGWAGIGQADLPDFVFKISYAPYGWLFPKMGGIVHHGGSGTTAFAFRSGVPSLVVPFLFDQFYWGRRGFELGVGPRPIPFKKLSVGRLAEAFKVMTTDEGMRGKAAVLGKKLQAENGLAQGVALISRIGAG